MAAGGEASLYSGSEFIYDFFCEVCVDDDKHLEAHGYCENCEDYLCEECYNAHTKPRSTRHHVIQDKYSMPKDKPISTDRVNKTIETKCKYHMDQFVEFYCNSHDVFGCSTCLANVHRNCQYVILMQEISENFFDNQDYKKFISQLTAMRNKADKLIKLSSSNTSSAHKCCSKFVAAIRQTMKNIIKVLNETEDTMVSLAKRICSEDEEDMKHLATECKHELKIIEQMLSDVQRLQSSKRACQLFIKMKETEGEIKTHEENLKSSESKNTMRMYRLEPNIDVINALRAPDALGKLSHLGRQVIDAQLTSPDVPSNVIASKISDIDISSSCDTETCYITGSAVLSSNRVIIADHNNSKVKLLHIHNKTLISEIELSSAPWDITVVPQSRIAITLPFSDTIMLLNVKHRVKKEREIKVGKGCYGIASLQDKLMVSFASGSNCRLKILDLSGDVIRIIENNDDGRQLFVVPFYVCVSNNGDAIYVSDQGSHTVTSLTMQGVVKSVYEDEEAIYPRGVCSDNKGNVYVCGYGSKTVHMITADCTKVKVILTQADGLDSDVLSVSHCQDTNRLFVGMEGKFIKVFTIS